MPASEASVAARSTGGYPFMILAGQERRTVEGQGHMAVIGTRG